MAQVQVFKVKHDKSPHGSALKISNAQGAEYHFFDPKKDIWATPSKTFSICTTANKCCDVDTMYKTTMEQINLAQLKSQYQHGLDHWLFYYYLCEGKRKPLFTEEDKLAVHTFTTETSEDYIKMKTFLTWFENMTIK
jgi:hypothetical protein